LFQLHPCALEHTICKSLCIIIDGRCASYDGAEAGEEILVAQRPSLLINSAPLVLVDAGYERVDEFAYKAIWSTPEVEHFIYLIEEQKKKNYLTGDFGIKNSLAEAFSCDSIHIYGGDIFKCFRCAEPTTCAMRFSFARLEPSAWPMTLAGLSETEFAQRLRDFINNYLLPAISHVTTLLDLFSLLAADTSHCPWVASNGAIRAAQIVALAGQLGLDDLVPREILESHRSFIGHGVSKSSEIRSNPTMYIEMIIRDWIAGGYRPGKPRPIH
jgi:hypothetical protein